MSATERIVDPYPEARQTINATCSALIAAGKVLDNMELSAEQRRELAGMVAERAKELSDHAQRVVAS